MTGIGISVILFCLCPWVTNPHFLPIHPGLNEANFNLQDKIRIHILDPWTTDIYTSDIAEISCSQGGQQFGALAEWWGSEPSMLRCSLLWGLHTDSGLTQALF